MSAVVSFTAYAAATSFFVAMRSRDQNAMKIKYLQDLRGKFEKARERRLKERRNASRGIPDGSDAHH